MDKNYWETFYAEQNTDLKPSLFARYIAEQFTSKGKTFIELGCGNGRDAIFFANEGANVLAVDQCKTEIKFLQNRYKYLDNIKFESADFTNLSNNNCFDIVYSRFTLHSISAEEEKRIIEWVYCHLNLNGVFCIEVRGQKNEIFGKGEPVAGEANAFVYNQHYRRFLAFDQFCKTLIDKGFVVKYAAEQKGFAPYKGEDETYIRVIAQKI